MFASDVELWVKGFMTVKIYDGCVLLKGWTPPPFKNNDTPNLLEANLIFLQSISKTCTLVSSRTIISSILAIRSSHLSRYMARSCRCHDPYFYFTLIKISAGSSFQADSCVMIRPSAPILNTSSAFISYIKNNSMTKVSLFSHDYRQVGHSSILINSLEVCVKPY